MLYSSLFEYYKNINLMLDYKYSVTEIEEMIPFERDIHVDLIIRSQKESDSPDVQTEAPLD